MMNHNNKQAVSASAVELLRFRIRVLPSDDVDYEDACAVVYRYIVDVSYNLQSSITLPIVTLDNLMLINIKALIGAYTRRRVCLLSVCRKKDFVIFFIQ